MLLFLGLPSGEWESEVPLGERKQFQPISGHAKPLLFLVQPPDILQSETMCELGGVLCVDVSQLEVGEYVGGIGDGDYFPLLFTVLLA